ncbi:MAG: alpha/beta fold hydrolase [Candidatus Magnetominusculus sp. LBB02]|nr:alpha/beta fold hydrolase [Candidatus Magnetominusculus sp. LBB02]
MITNGLTNDAATGQGGLDIDLKGGGSAVLLIHGLTGSPFELKYLARKLHKVGFSVRAPLLAGHASTLKELRATTWQDWYACALRAFDQLCQSHDSVFIGGLCMGSVLALYIAIERQESVSGLSLMSTTLFFDGWSIPWYRRLLPIAYHTPIENFFSFKERHPYGIKNEVMRRWVLELMKEKRIAYSSVPLKSVHELQKLSDKVKQEAHRVKSPALILHSVEDDIASIKNVRFIERHIASTALRTVLLHDCYHMVTIDNQRSIVEKETIDFFASLL